MITTSDVSNAAHGVVRTDFLILSRVSSQVDKESNSSGTLQWVSRNDQANVVTTPFLPDAIYRLSQRHPLCVTGTLLDALQVSFCGTHFNQAVRDYDALILAYDILGPRHRRLPRSS